MGNVLQFIIQLKDQMSAGVMGAASNVNRAFEGMNRRVHATGRSISDINTRLAELRRSHEISVDTRQIANARRQIDALERQRNRLSNLGSGKNPFNNIVGSALPYVGGAALIGGGSESIQTGMQFQRKKNAINFGTRGRGNEAIAQITKETDRLGINTESSIEGFRTLSGSLRDMKLEKQMNIFNGVSASVAAMGLSGEDAKGTFLALGQIASKGTVSAEELRGQIGERIPGAFSIAAKAMGVTEKKLGDMMQKGEIASSVFLPKFAAEMQKTFGQAASLNVNSASANFERFNNVLYDLKIVVSEQLLPAIVPLLKDYIIPAVKWVAAHAAGIIKLVAVVGSIVAIVKIWTIAQWLLNIALTANPIGLIVVAIAAAIAGITALVFWIKKAREEGQSWWEILKKISWVLLNINTLGLPAVIDYWASSFKSGAEKAMETMKEVLEKGISNNQIYSFFERMGKVHSAAYVNALLSRMKGVTEYMDRLYGNSMYGSIFDKIKLGAQGKNPKEIVFHGKAKKKVDPYALPDQNAGEKNKAKVKDHTESITGGGAKNIYITLGKFQDQLNIHTMTVKEGVNEMEAMIENSLLRILNSANAISN